MTLTDGDKCLIESYTFLMNYTTIYCMKPRDAEQNGPGFIIWKCGFSSWMNIKSFQQPSKKAIVFVVTERFLMCPIYLSQAFQGFFFIRCNLPHTKMWTSPVPVACYSWRPTWTVLPAVTEKQRSIKYKSVVINSSMTWGGGCFQSFQSMQSLAIQLSLFIEISNFSSNVG